MHPDERHLHPSVFVELEERLKKLDSQKNPFPEVFSPVRLSSSFHRMAVRNIRRVEAETKGEK
jgi:hypothetical protein